VHTVRFWQQPDVLDRQSESAPAGKAVPAQAVGHAPQTPVQPPAAQAEAKAGAAAPPAATPAAAAAAAAAAATSGAAQAAEPDASDAASEASDEAPEAPQPPEPALWLVCGTAAGVVRIATADAAILTALRTGA
jgi:hypothetical protein